MSGRNTVYRKEVVYNELNYNNDIYLQHINSVKFLGLKFNYLINFAYLNSPMSEHTEVSCNASGGYFAIDWKVNHSKLENRQRYLKSNDVVNLSIKNSFDNNGQIQNDKVAFLRSHDIQFTIGNDTFQEVVCHNERLGGNDEWRIELIKQD
ncbi:hypothetical protein C1646_709849 [Rhizophagus diaphanus]|nr:hypothetical protein C1646_709849 [Rhizophagus diaphanus] [Rhizophagus sp. MUCL 43196]